MVGYSGTPLPKKLGIKPAHAVAFPGAPENFAATLGELPDGVTVKRRAVAPLDVVVAFFTARNVLERRLGALAKAIYPHGGLWIAWPKRSSGVATDLTEDVVRELALAAGLVDNKVCAIARIARRRVEREPRAARRSARSRARACRPARPAATRRAPH